MNGAFLIICISIIALLPCRSGALDCYISLSDAHINWMNDEYVYGGHIFIHDGTVKDFHNTRLVGFVHNQTKLHRAVIDLMYSQPGGTPPDKAGEYPFLSNWFIVHTIKNSNLGERCGVHIDGTIFLRKSPPDQRVKVREVRINTTDFVIRKITR